MSTENDHPQGAAAGSDAPEAAESPTALAQGLPAVAPDLIEEIFADEIDNIVPTHGYHQMPVVALGGSAGSIQALKIFFQALPAETGMAYVVILHLSPDHTSTLPELLQGATAMPVRAAQDAERLEANHVYVIPPGKHLLVVNGHLRLTALEPERGKRMAVDVFFRTLADTHGPHATAIVLSGADSDGANGLKRIKERGGLTIAQDPEEAEHATMPRTAIDTGMVDWVLRVGDMPARVLEYRRNAAALRLPSEEGPQPARPAPPPPDGDEAALREVLAFLRTRTTHDFSYYKRATIVRRISRRMQINGVTDLPGYVIFLRTQAGEAGALLQDLLISVTNFFRDRDAFAALERDIIPTLFADKGPEDTVRAWTSACATGEEAYSVAMLLVEHARTLDHPPGVQVFACDLDEAAIAQARTGVYALSIAADVSEERLARFFVKDARGYRVRRELREIVLFAEHDLLKDAPFSKLDFASCRNLLIYLNREAQTRALEIFHFALKPEGRLFLGSSETVPEENELFETLDKKHRFYVRRPVPRVGLAVPTGTGTLQRVLHAREAMVLPGPIFSRAVAATISRWSALPPSEERAALTELHFRFIERCAPPSVLLDEHHGIVHLSENAGRFLQPVGGQPTTNLLRMVHPDLRTDLRGGLFQVVETGASVEIFGVPLTMDGEARMVDLRIAPAAELAPGYLLVSFAARDPDPASGTASPRLETETVVRHLEQEVEHVRGRLRDTVERYEASAEEYKSSHEELQSMNEELRSASEELETSREELQSINEELTTVNQELKSNVEELGHSNSDLQNLMNATGIVTVFLDRELRITRFTPNASGLFFFIQTDLGRPLAHVKLRLDYPDLLADAQTVLRTLVPIEREVNGPEDQRWFLVRLQPYRTLEDQIGGLVLTFVDITEHKGTQEALQQSEEQFRSFVEASSDTVYKMSADWTEMRYLGGKQFLADTQGPSRTWPETYIPPEDQPPVLLAIQEAIRGKWPFEMVHRVIRADGATGWAFSRAVPLLDARGKIREWIGVASDVTERRRIDAERRQAEERLRQIVNSATDYAIFALDLERRVTAWSPGAQAMLGYAEPDILGRSGDLLFTPEDRAANVPAQEAGKAAREGRADNERYHLRQDGSRFYGSGVSMPLREDDGTIIGFVKIMRDLTEAKRAEEALRESQERLHTAVAIAQLGTCDWDYVTGEVRGNAQRFRMFGLDPAAEVMPMRQVVGMFHPEDRERVWLHFVQGIEERGELAEVYRIVRPDGAVRWISQSGRVTARRQDGWPLRIESVLLDITTQYEAEAAIHESETRFRTLADVVPQVIWTNDGDGKANYFNGRWFEYSGLSQEESTGLGWEAIVHPDDAPASKEKWQRALAAGEIFDSEYRLRRADGAYRWHIGRNVPLKDEAGRVLGWFGSATDIEDLVRARAEAEAANAAKDHFLAVLSHELRTPLMPITMALHALARRGDLPSPVRQAHAMIERNVELEAHFIDEMLDMTRISRGKLEIDRQDMDLHEAIRRAVEVSSPDLEAKGQVLTVSLDAGEHRVSGDFARLQQAMWNLLKNAAKFTPAKGAVSLRTRNEPGQIIVEVTDTGIGMEPGALTRIFHPFEQADASITRLFGGLGLGLAIAKGTAEAHGGELRASSPGPGQGATFTLSLPL